MLLTISTTHYPATDLGFLLHKNPARIQSFSLNFGNAYVFYPEATAEKCTAALLLDIDPVGLVRGRRGERTLEQYVNDRPYVASSFFSVALGSVFRSGISGKTGSHEELANREIPLEAMISVLPSRGGEELLRKLFEPLGYELLAERLPLDEKFPEWGESSYFKVMLKANKRLQDLLTHLYVLIPVLDNEKHYWVGDEEVEKLLRHGESWLPAHPERQLITRRYLKYRTSLAREALSRLIPEEEGEEQTGQPAKEANSEEKLEKPLSLNEQRYQTVLSVLRDLEAKRVIDVGCGEGKLMRYLVEERSFQKIAGLDVSHRALEIATERLRLERLPEKLREKIWLFHGSLTYRDKRMEGYDAATVIEVIEHLDAARLSAFERVLFEFAQPKAVVLSTPNVEYNVKFEGLPPGKFRHSDHRFEWTRAEFKEWAERIADKFNYEVNYKNIGDVDPELGAPTQMAVFTK